MHLRSGGGNARSACPPLIFPAIFKKGKGIKARVSKGLASGWISGRLSLLISSIYEV
jgi:hypothetical protein